MYIFQDEFMPTRSESLAIQRMSSVCRSAGGWIIGERFNDRFNTEVGGFHTIAKQWIGENGQLQGDWSRSPSGQIETRRNPSTIIDYVNDGRQYTIEEAETVTDLADVLLRLKERERAYVRFLDNKEQSRIRFEQRQSIAVRERKDRGVRFLPIQVLRSAYVKADLQDHWDYQGSKGKR